VKKKSIVSEPAMHSLPAWQGLQPVTPFDISDRLTEKIPGLTHLFAYNS
jgi:hypothetical protein